MRPSDNGSLKTMLIIGVGIIVLPSLSIRLFGGRGRGREWSSLLNLPNRELKQRRRQRQRKRHLKI